MNSAAPRVPVIPLAEVPAATTGWGRSKLVVLSWVVAELVFVTNPLQLSSALRIWILRLFGASIGKRVIVRPRTRVRFPWNLQIGDGSWIGDGVWISNREMVSIGHDVVVSQGTFITTGGHAVRTDMRVVSSPIQIEEGAWLTTRCVVLGGSSIGRSAVIEPNTVVRGRVPSNVIWGSLPRPGAVRLRFEGAWSE